MIAPTVSLVIPAYNHADFLEEAIESVLAQDYPHVELIVLDDGSTDGTRALLRKYSGRFHCESQQNMGQAATLNRGWDLSRGSILGYLSADDVLKPGCVGAAVAAMEAHPNDVLTYCDFELIDSSSRRIRTVHAPDFDYPEMVAELVCAPGPGVFFRRTAFQRAGGWDTSFAQMPDFQYWLRLGLLGPFRRIPRTLAAFRVHEGSLTFAATSERNAEEPVRIIEEYFALREIPGSIRRQEARALSNASLFSAQLHLRSGRYRAAYAHLQRAAALHPANLFRWRALRRVLNALFNRLGYRLLWLMKPGAASKSP